MIKILKKIGLVFSWLILVVVLLCTIFYFKHQPAQTVDWGLTFSSHEARGLGFDDRQMYLDILTDLKPKTIRLMSYWEDLERTRGRFDFSSVDWMLNEAAKNNVDVVLVVGRKQPRWPECHEPEWFKTLPKTEQDEAVLNLVRKSIEHFKTFSVIKEWQVENEPYFIFGDNCPAVDSALFEKEVALVKSLDSRPIIVTDSGDRGGWLGVAKTNPSALGITLYRLSYDEKYGGYYKYPLPGAYYKIRSGILRTFSNVDVVWDMELQMEPWFTNGALNTPLDVQKTLMNQKVFADNIAYAENLSLGRHYLWGVEWWYWMAKKNNDWGMWASAKDLFAKNR